MKPFLAGVVVIFTLATKGPKTLIFLLFYDSQMTEIE